MSELDEQASVEGAVVPPEALPEAKAPRTIPGLGGHQPLKHYAITLFPVAVLLGCAVMFHEFILAVIIANPVLNILILTVMLSGMSIILRRVRSVQVEYSVLTKFANAYAEDRPIAEVLQDEKIFFSGVGHVVSHIADNDGKVSSSLVHSSLNEEINHLQNRFQAAYEVPNFIVGFMIAMGLTGTFIGLLETMLGISAMLGNISNDPSADMTQAVMGLIAELQKPLAGMGTAFSASLFGLIGSVTLGMMMVALKSAVAEFMNGLRRYVTAVVEHTAVESGGTQQRGALKEASRGGVSEAFLSDFIVDMMDQQAQTQEIFRQSQENSVKLAVRLDKLADNINGVGDLLRAQVETAKRTYDLLSYGPRMRDLAEETLSEIRRLGDIQKNQGSLTGETTRAIGNVDQRIVSVGMQLDELSQWMSSDSGQKQNGTKGLLNALVNLQDKMTQVVQESEQTRNVSIDIARHLSSQAESQKKLIELLGFGGRMRDIADQTLSEIKQLASIQREESTALVDLTTTIGNLDQRFVRISNQLTQLSNDLLRQGEDGRVDVKSIAGNLSSLQEQLAQVAKESSQSRQVTIDIARHLAEANANLSELRSGNTTLTKIQDGASGQLLALEMLLSEMRNARTSIIRDLRSELRELSRATAAAQEKSSEDESS